MATAPSHVESVRQDLFAEPLGGPISPNRLLDSFPDELYDKSPNSHFYKFMYAILGPAGIGSIVKSYFEARLKFLEYGVELFDIERFYGDPFRFGRILEEQVTMDVDSSLLPENWEAIKAQDESYRSRALDFFNAVRLGGTPLGMRYAAKSGLGHDVEIFERYKWIFDNLSDQPLGLPSWGYTDSLNEFTIVPRIASAVNEVQRIKFEASTALGSWTLTFRGHTTSAFTATSDVADVEAALRALPNIGTNGVRVTGGPMPLLPFDVQFVGPLANEDVPALTARSLLTDAGGLPLNIEVTTEEAGVAPISQLQKIPDRLAHNVESAVDRLRPVNSLPTFNYGQPTMSNRAWQKVESSSTFSEVVRYVTGKLDVQWSGRGLDTNKYWIEPGIEKTAKKKYGTGISHYLSFHNIASVSAYDGANFDETVVPVEDNYSEGKDFLPTQMIDPNPDSRNIVDGLIQGIYPQEYSSLSGVTTITSDDRYWKSIERIGGNSDFIEIDLGEAKPVNFIHFDVGKAPVNVFIDYEAWDQYPARKFAEITPKDSTFSGWVDETGENDWHTVTCPFTDSNGNTPITRVLRIRIVRRYEQEPPSWGSNLWPPLGPISLSVSVRGLKVGRMATS
jgi:hypothetical protein